jgi:hypothetical protein
MAKTGWGIAKGISFEIIIAKKLVIDQGFYSYELLSAMPVDWDDVNGFAISRIDPPDTSDADLTILK